ncbi:MAG: response regulator [Chloroflexi bacterium]|nr:response regulator [Chloroflexota bacterium]MDA0245142.1 response regulator [Chloroflexota bacterium]
MKTILVIDDEEIVREAVQDILDTIGVQVLEAANGRTGIEVYRQNHDRIDAILLDMKMPGLSGAETLRQLREVDAAVPVILSSGYAEEETRRNIDDHKATTFLPKPYNFETLIEKVQQALGE